MPLAQVRSIESLSGLLAALGHEPLHELVPGLVPGRPGNKSGLGLIVGRTGEFPWIGVEGPHPGRLARGIARGMAERGRVAGVLALDTPGRRLGIAVAFDGTPWLEIGLDAPEPAAVACLSRLSGPRPGGAWTFAARVADALSGESVGRRFFREFKVALDRMTEGLPRILREADRRSLALLQLTRVLFLYFVQAKGWLAGRERFLAEEVDRCLAGKRRIHRDLLRPLFFGTLNCPPPDRRRGAARFGAVPFLNGGLFEPHPLERRLRGDIGNAVWRQAFDGLFERFHFVVSEGGKAGGIAPDMLGRVFEGVMAPDVRRASGTYYTPAALVRSILDAAFVAFVAGRAKCTEPEAERRLASRDPDVVALLGTVTVLDPAAGSGAFLLGALERLSALTATDSLPSAAVRRRVLQRNLFGVDASAAAVRLTELRLWLAVIADDREQQPERIEPLPNLDCLVRQGDSLFEPTGAFRLRVAEPALADAVAGLRRSLVSASGAPKRELVRELREAECRAAGASLAAGETEARRRIDELIGAARSADLFGGRRGLDFELRAELAGVRLELRALRAARRSLVREREVPWFHFQSHFADVFVGGGFDIVAGNPPWLRAEDLPADVRSRLTGRYRWWRGAAGGFGNRPDLAVAFAERALELTAPGGIVALLVPAKLATAGYGVAARHALAASTTLVHVADLTGRPDVAFDATVYPLALVARNEPPSHGHRVRTRLDRAAQATLPQARLRGGGPWILTADRGHAVVSRLKRDHSEFGLELTCHLGVKTGANHLFLDPPEDIEPALLRWAVRGRDLHAFAVRPSVRLLWTHGPGGGPLARLPPHAAAHLAPHDATLRARADYAGGPAWTLFRAHAATSAHRVVWSDLGRRLTACALTGRRDADRVPLNTCYVAPAPTRHAAERLAAWLNSTWIRAVARAGAVPAAGGFHRYTAAVVSRLPLPAGVAADAELSRLARAGRRGEAVQEALDEIAAKYLGLSGSDRAALARLVAHGAVSRR